ncbi:hypothetical protein MMC20_007893 [Loxospora ochrophaea]|nr:hypothetical protein [Loxospora ochrophaea]
MGEPVKKGEFLGEYVGEVVSNDEAETRGLIYNKRNLSYLFSLNRTQTLDSTRVGNKFRYINHQALPYANCYAKVLLCNSVHRIGLFAAKSLRIGEELLFDYGSEFTSRFDLIKLNDNAPPTIEKSRRGFVHKKSDPSIQGLAKKTGGRLGRRQKNISVEQSPNFRKGRAPKNDAVRKLVTIDDDIIEIVGGTIEDPKPKANPRKRKTIIEDEEDDNTSEVAGPSNAPIEAVSSSESYHESDEVEDDVLDEEPSIEEDGSSEPEHETPQKRGWRTRRANMGFGLDGAYETPQKRGWRTRKANSLLAQGKGKRRRRRWATNRTPKSASKSSPSVPASAGASGDKEGMPNAQKRGWVTRYANMEKRKAEQAMPRPQY